MRKYRVNAIVDGRHRTQIVRASSEANARKDAQLWGDKVEIVRVQKIGGPLMLR